MCRATGIIVINKKLNIEPLSSIITSVEIFVTFIIKQLNIIIITYSPSLRLTPSGYGHSNILKTLFLNKFKATWK